MSAVRVLVTGGTGVVGRWTLDPLLRAGAEVHATTTSAAPDAAGPVAAVCWHRVDLHDARSVDDLLAQTRPTHLLHAAWFVDPATYVTSLENLRWVGTTLHLAEAFRRVGGSRVVAVGTSAEYAAEAAVCVERQTAIAPVTLYAAAKRAVYDVLERWAAQVGVSFGWARLFFVYGPGEGPERLVPALIRAAHSGAPFPLRFPRQIRDYMHTADAGAALAAFALSDVRDAVNIASGHAVTLGDIAHEIGHLMGRPVPLEAGAGATADPMPRRVADITRLTEEVGFRPRYALAEGLKETVAWWQAGQHLVLR